MKDKFDFEFFNISGDFKAKVFMIFLALFSVLCKESDILPYLLRMLKDIRVIVIFLALLRDLCIDLKNHTMLLNTRSRILQI